MCVTMRAHNAEDITSPFSRFDAVNASNREAISKSDSMSIGAGWMPHEVATGEAAKNRKDFDGGGAVCTRRGFPAELPATRSSDVYRSSRRSRRALVMTETLLTLMAAAAIMGLKRIPKNG